MLASSLPDQSLSLIMSRETLISTVEERRPQVNYLGSSSSSILFIALGKKKHSTNLFQFPDL